MLNNDYKPASSIAWITLPRTGSNYLCELLHNHYRIQSHYEIFHKHKFYARNRNQIIDLINKKYYTNFTDYRDLNLIKWIHYNPHSLLSILKENSCGDYFSFKIFPGQLNQRSVREVIINDSSIKKILVQRNLLDVYISRMLALKLGKWGHTNTSEIKLQVDYDDFIQWFTWVEQWYRFFEESLTSIGQNFSVMSYKGLHSNESDKDKFVYLINFLRTVDINLELREVVNTMQNAVVYKKQDLRANIADKIANYAEFEKKLHNTGLEYLLIS